MELGSLGCMVVLAPEGAAEWQFAGDGPYMRGQRTFGSGLR